MRKAMALASLAATILLGRTASAQQAAQGMHESGGFIVSAERLFGLSFWSIHNQRDATPGVLGATPVDTTTSGTHISLLYGAAFAGVTDGVIVPYTVPRLAFDFLPIESLTLGGSIGFVSATGERKATDGTTRDSPTITAFTIAPRVGYILPLGDIFYFWPRLGLSYYGLSSESQTGGGTDSWHGFAINIEPAFVLAPVPHFGISLMPVADIPLSGTETAEDPGPPPTSRDETLTIRNFGLTVGILGYF
jgi:hypothetical protein